MEYREFKAKTVDEAITLASTEFGCVSTDLEYEVIEKGTSGFLGIGAKPAVIKAKKKESFLDTLENLAKNISFKVKRTRRPFTLEPMNPYERRIIHSALQNDKYVATRSEGEEPYRKVVIYLKKNA